MIPQDPVSVSVIAFLVVFAVGTAWLMVGRQALANAARQTASTGTSAGGGVLIGVDGMPGARKNGLAKRGRGRLEPVRGGLSARRASEIVDTKEDDRAKPTERYRKATEDSQAKKSQTVDRVRGRSADAVPTEAAGVRSVAQISNPTPESAGRVGRKVTGPSAPLSAEQQWSRITEIVRGDIECAERADSFHAAANQQLDAVDYAIARLREEMESISAGGAEVTRRREASSRAASKPARSGFVPLLGARETDAVALPPADCSETPVSRPEAEFGSDSISVREPVAASSASGKPHRRSRGKSKRAKEKSIAA